MKFDAFISYRRKSGFEIAQLIRDRLKEKGISCFLDLEHDRAETTDEKLYTAISNSSNFILILSKKALNRCVKKDDWVRKEILEAVRLGKSIIPIEYPDFTWPKKLNRALPEQIARLEAQHRVPFSQDYFPYMIDKILSCMTDIEIKPVNPKKSSLYVETSRFILDNARDNDALISIDMAFHAGSEWMRNTDMVASLSELQKEGCTVRVIINSAEAAERVCKHMRQPMKKYVKFEQNISDWVEMAKLYPHCIQLRVLDVPLLHRLYIVRGKDGGQANVKYYSYGNYTPEKDFRLSFESPDPEYQLYADEFEYLWGIATPI
ncbi:MAG: toll/interleukin-1 receptor domain-containing protein [Clostridia bacterium]|nr:toll/interleukin-1 receptor domain-containing protein [Clostridia bacterium]